MGWLPTMICIFQFQSSSHHVPCYLYYENRETNHKIIELVLSLIWTNTPCSSARSRINKLLPCNCRAQGVGTRWKKLGACFLAVMSSTVYVFKLGGLGNPSSCHFQKMSPRKRTRRLVAHGRECYVGCLFWQVGSCYS